MHVACIVSVIACMQSEHASESLADDSVCIFVGHSQWANGPRNFIWLELNFGCAYACLWCICMAVCGWLVFGLKSNCRANARSRNDHRRGIKSKRSHGKQQQQGGAAMFNNTKMRPPAYLALFITPIPIQMIGMERKKRTLLDVLTRLGD